MQKVFGTVEVEIVINDQPYWLKGSTGFDVVLNLDPNMSSVLNEWRSKLGLGNAEFHAHVGTVTPGLSKEDLEWNEGSLVQEWASQWHPPLRLTCSRPKMTSRMRSKLSTRRSCWAVLHVHVNPKLCVGRTRRHAYCAGTLPIAMRISESPC